jgi:hypothetical protein
MAQAQAPQGIPQLESNLPAQGMAAGGIVAFARGGYGDETSEDDDDDYYERCMDAAQQRHLSQLRASRLAIRMFGESEWGICRRLYIHIHRRTFVLQIALGVPARTASRPRWTIG